MWGSHEGKINGPDRAEDQEVAEAELEPKHQSLSQGEESRVSQVILPGIITFLLFWEKWISNTDPPKYRSRT